MDINKLIMESIQSVISESAVPEDLQPGAKEAAEAAAKRVADKVIHGEVPEELQAGAETKKMVARRLLNQGKEAIEEHPGLAAGSAAALAAALGAVAFRKKLAALAKQGGDKAKKAGAKVAKKIAHKLES